MPTVVVQGRKSGGGVLLSSKMCNFCLEKCSPSANRPGKVCPPRYHIKAFTKRVLVSKVRRPAKTYNLETQYGVNVMTLPKLIASFFKEQHAPGRLKLLEVLHNKPVDKLVNPR